MKYPDVFIRHYDEMFRSEASFHVFQSYELIITAPEYECLVNNLTEKCNEVFFEELRKGKSVSEALKKVKILFEKQE